MQVFALLPILASFLTVSPVSAGVVKFATSPATCAKETVVSEGFIGKDNNVKFQLSHCDAAVHVASNGLVSVNKRQESPAVNVCGAQCASISSYLP